MITLLHGDNVVASRSFLTSLKKKYPQTKNFSVKSVNELIDHLVIQTMLVQEELVVVEGYSKELLERIKEAQTTKEVVLWSEKTVSSPPRDIKVLEFKGNFKGNAYKLVDSVGLKDLKKSLVILEALEKEKFPFEIIIGTLYRQFKLILAFKERESLPVADFIKEKLAKQSPRWAIQELILAIKGLAALDEKIKTGQVSAGIGLTYFLSKIIVD